jgi:hypothetical protein
MNIKNVINVLHEEREYQERQKGLEESHVVEDFPLSAGLVAIEYNLNKAKEAWYEGKSPHTLSMNYLRKIGAICIQMGELNGMPRRL